MSEIWIFILLTAAFLTPTSAALAVAWHRANRRVRDLERRLEYVGSPDGQAEMSAAIDALSAQIDRLAEGQEFLTRVVADRLGLPPGHPPSARAATTPV